MGLSTKLMQEFRAVLLEGQIFLKSSEGWPHGVGIRGISLFNPQNSPTTAAFIKTTFTQRENDDEIGDWETYYHDVGNRAACGEFVCPSNRRRVWWRAKAA